MRFNSTGMKSGLGARGRAGAGGDFRRGSPALTRAGWRSSALPLFHMICTPMQCRMKALSHSSTDATAVRALLADVRARILEKPRHESVRCSIQEAA